MRKAAVVALFAVAAVLLGGCKKHEPSPEYAQALTLHSQLVGKLDDDAYFDPKMNEVEALLARVDPNSSDAQAAEILKKRIDDARARQIAANHARDKSIAAGIKTPTPARSSAAPAAGWGIPQPQTQTAQDNTRCVTDCKSQRTACLIGAGCVVTDVVDTAGSGMTKVDISCRDGAPPEAANGCFDAVNACLRRCGGG